jgi:NTE family protein
MRKIGLALGGGAVLGAAHIGVLRALEEKKLQIGSITGTSIGAFIAALYAFGISPHEIEEKIADLNWLDAAEFSFSRYGLLSNEKLGDTLKMTLGDVDMENAGIPLAVVATDIGACRKVILKEGSVAKSVMASSCIPGIFIPVELGGRLLVDGGLVENVPISPLKEMGANMVVGVDLNANRKYKKPEDLIDVLANALDLVIDNATRIQMEEADILIAPELSAYNRTDVEMVHDLVKEGYDTAKAILTEI